MTRINVVHPKELTDKHLLAEYRELPRVFALAHSWYMQGGQFDTLTREYTLGHGHVRFFYNKLGYCTKRHALLVNEMLSRGFRVTYKNPPSITISALAGDWTPTSNAIRINRERIDERLKQSAERSKMKSAPSR